MTRRRRQSGAPVTPVNGDPSVQGRRLIKRYGELTTVDGVDLTVRPQRAGETTTLRTLSASCAPDAGSIRLFGPDPAEDPTPRA
jgi:ABC-type multidrug transport system ATPase subunit